MDLKDTYNDFLFLENLPGKKLLLKGNHDYWWNTLTSMRKFLKENNFKSIDFIYNNSYLVEDKIIVGTRGWTFIGEDASDKILARENQRLVLSIEDGIKKYGEEKEIIAFIHYPPIVKDQDGAIKDRIFLNTFQKFHIKSCYYGHLHGGAHKEALEGNIEGIDFKLISGDYINFDFVKVL